MKINPNDPKLTAYALGEIQDENERRAIEEFLELSEEARQQVDSIREAAALLTSELQNEPAPLLSQQQHHKIATKSQGRSYAFLDLARSRWALVGGLAAAACLILAINVSLLSPEQGALVEQMARLESPAIVTTSGPGQGTASAVEEDKPVFSLEQTDSEGSAGQPKERKGALDERAQNHQPVQKEQRALVDTSARRELIAKQSKAKLQELSSTRAKSPTVTTIPSSSSELAHFFAPAAPAAGVPGGVVGGVAGGAVPGAIGGVHVMSEPRLRASAPAPDIAPGDSRQVRDFNTEAYDQIVDNPFMEVTQNPLSTFSIDVDTASYSNMRRFLKRGVLPPRGAVRIEEMVNYFSYDYAAPSGSDPFSVQVEIAQAPWELQHRLVRVGIKGKEINLAKRPSSNLVFLLDVSGSMRPKNKLPLLKKAMRLLVEKLGENDRVAIAVYAGASGLVLPSTSCDKKEQILASLDRLQAGGSTNGASGIQLAYNTAVSNFIAGGINRVILATDGDFNVGVTNQSDLIQMIEEKAKSGVFLSVLGFGVGNYKDSTIEKIADKGNGNYAYIDTLNEARKVLVSEMGGTLITIAKDVKIQIEFNPAQVKAYRLIGYENRMLRAQDFSDDTKDAGEIGAGHTVTALYEVVPVGESVDVPKVDPLKYQKPREITSGSNEILTLKLRYKEPSGQTSKPMEFPIRDQARLYSQASVDFKFAAAVASFGMILRDSPHKGNATLNGALELAIEGKGEDTHGYRGEFIELVKRAGSIQK